MGSTIMLLIEKELKAFFRNCPIREDKPRLTSGKIPVGQLYKAIQDTGKQELLSYINKEPQKKFSATKLRLFDLGHILEAYLLSLMTGKLVDPSTHQPEIVDSLIDKMQKQFALASKQSTLENEFLKGKIDCTLANSTGKRYICDIKTMNDTNYGLLVHGIISEATKIQIMTYIWLWNETQDAPIEQEGIILAYNKNDSRVKPFVVEYKKENIEHYLVAAKEIMTLKAYK